MTQQFTTGDRVRVDIPDETDPDHERYHGCHGTVSKVIEDDASIETGDERDGIIYRIEFEDGTTIDLAGVSSAGSSIPSASLGVKPSRPFRKLVVPTQMPNRH